ncbi:DNA replication licensing factor MCM7 [Polychytrium aggregatum]|uniref:DNA replication licensing factor MCM7 n=1 Tax=Polychytrium aggregatum TaxID=110093 RepID=UPI0022FE0A51|nr:DNA replication licensing factor MCM7 [Polychytrium aggregatum]KAI9204271.1 MCM2/3/5 family-domain-containing protein [Polychytrium aggregatum]
MTSTAPIRINYQEELTKITNFLQKFTIEVDDNVHERQATPTLHFKYLEDIKVIAQKRGGAITIDMNDVASHDPTDLEFIENIESNTARYTDLFTRAIENIMPENNEPPSIDSHSVDVLIYQRRQHLAQLGNPVEGSLPPILSRRFVVYIKPRDQTKAMAVREIKGKHVGHLVTVRGMVTRVTNVKPQAQILCYSCDRCGAENFQPVTSRTFKMLSECGSEECKKNGYKGKLYLQVRASRFLKFQEVKIQEMPDQVPMGHIPRSMTVHVYEDLTRALNPGEAVLISGIFLPIPHTGFKALKAGLITETYLEAQHIVQLKKQYTHMTATEAIEEQIEELKQSPNLYERMASSIAPEIYGEENVKKALLLLLIGGAQKETGDGMKIRGDINVCMMGDPGVAKSQLLKYISKISPRGVYTTGRGSSGVGLTASVIRDPVTDEMILEGGALVLADNGIACIDEFDKMDENDRTAIHEVMEQQTISISKAGITTTLNARTSILAAANPQFGRYNPYKSATENINLPPALLSRFDLLFLMLDKPDLDRDLRLAQHVAYVHMHSVHPTGDRQVELLSIDMMRHYIAKAKTFSPKVPRNVGDYMVNAYAHLRSKMREMSGLQYTTARTLLSVIRLSSALARLRQSDEIAIDDVDEALRLIDVSKASLTEQRHGGGRSMEPTAAIFGLLREMSKNADGSMKRSLRFTAIKERAIAKGYSEEQVWETLRLPAYEHMFVMIDNDSTLMWVGIDDDEEL